MIAEDQRWKALRTGEIAAFTALYKAYYQFLFSYGYRNYSDKDLVKDCIHELFLEIWNGHSNLPEVQHVGYYLKIILQRKLIREMQKKIHSAFDEHNERSIKDVELSYEDLLIELQSKEEMKEKVRNAILQLSPKQMEIIRMKFFEDRTYREIAAMTAVTQRTMYNQVYEALHILRNCLKIL